MFREYLRANPEAREEYAAVKREAAAEHPENIGAYNAAKADVCKAILERALADDCGHHPRAGGVNSAPAAGGDAGRTDGMRHVFQAGRVST